MKYILLFLAPVCLYAKQLEDRTTAPTMDFSQVERVTSLTLPPGNIAVSANGRVFFTYNPEAKPSNKVVELVDGKIIPYPNKAFQKRGGDEGFDTVLSIRIDRQNRLWALDYGSYGRKGARLYAFDLATNTLVHAHHFSSSIAPSGSMLNDFQVDPNGEKIYIADTSVLKQRSALIVYDTRTANANRYWEGVEGVKNGDYDIYVHGKRVDFFLGTVPLKLGIDSIALDRNGEWLYFGATNGGQLFRVRTFDIPDATKIEKFADITLSDGMTTDFKGNIYLTDMEHSAVVRVSQDRKLETLLKDKRMRWPDGFSFAPGGWVYLTCTAMDEVLMTPQGKIIKNGPYPVFRFRPGEDGVPGH